MSENKHTRGPWMRDKYGNLVDGQGERVSFRSISILCASTDDLMVEAEANTDLAAAAPDLLQALDDLLRDAEDPMDKATTEYFRKQARSAIAKAKGDQP